MTIKEAAAYLECGEKTIRKMVAAGELEYYRIGLGTRGPIRITREALDDYRRRRTTAVAVNPILSTPLKRYFPPQHGAPRAAARGDRNGSKSS